MKINHFFEKILRIFWTERRLMALPDRVCFKRLAATNFKGFFEHLTTTTPFHFLVRAPGM